MKFYIIYCVQICFCVQSIVKARLDQPMIALKKSDTACQCSSNAKILIGI